MEQTMSELNLNGFHKDAKAAIQMAVDAGWTAVKQASGAIRLLPPEGQEALGEIRVPHTTKGFPGYRNAAKKISRTVSGVRLAALDAYAHGDIDDFGVDLDGDTVDGEVEQRRSRPQPPRVARVEPWLARKAPGKDGGTLYPSHAVLEREWDNGLIDYVCAHNGCDWSSSKPQSVARHYGAVHAKGKNPQAKPTAIDPDYVEPVTNRTYTPTPRLIGVFAEQIKALMDAGMDAVQMAEALLVFAHDRPDIEHVSRNTGALSAEQILDQIRLLVDKEAVADQISEAQSMADLLAQENADLQRQNDLLLTENDRLIRERIALRELLTDERDDK